MTISSHRPFPIRGALAALGVLLATFAGPAAAGITVSAPAGGVMPTNASFAVHWTTSLGGQISIWLESTSVPSHNYALLVTGNTTATGQALVLFPASADCEATTTPDTAVTASINVFIGSLLSRLRSQGSGLIHDLKGGYRWR